MRGPNKAPLFLPSDLVGCISSGEVHMSNDHLDAMFLKMAFEQASLARGLVSPNPMVGAVIVKNGRIIGRGHHKGPGHPHAEVEAINSAIEDIYGSTLYCNLEPCVHTNKRTPPCVPLIIEKKIARVVVSNIDPNPEVSGLGLEKLKEAGIEIECGLFEDEGKELNRVFFKYITQRRPYIHLKLAQSLDGKMAISNGLSKWISNDLARSEVHKLRQEYDAVMIGRNTANLDNPKLTARADNEIVKVPWRIVVGNPNKLNLDLDLFKDQFQEKTIVFSSEELKEKNPSYAQFIRLSEENFLEEMMNKLFELSITSVLVEGGAKLIESFLKKKLFDRLTLYTAPLFLGKGPSLFTNEEFNSMNEIINFENSQVRTLGNQAVFEISL